MTHQAKIGRWKTRAGLDAVVARIKTAGMKFLAYGAITCPGSGALVLHIWDVNGASITNPDQPAVFLDQPQ